MNLEELLRILDIDEPEEFIYFENFADLMEYEGEIKYETLYSLIKQVNMVNLGEFIETYFDDFLEGIPEEDGIVVYTFLTSVKMMLLGLAETIATAEEDEERDEIPVLAEELYKFRNWITRDSIVHLEKSKQERILTVTLLEAITAYRIEKLNGEEYIYNFEDCIPYEIDEYMVSFASAMSDLEDEEMDDMEEYFHDDDDDYEQEAE